MQFFCQNIVFIDFIVCKNLTNKGLKTLVWRNFHKQGVLYQLAFNNTTLILALAPSPLRGEGWGEGVNKLYYEAQIGITGIMQFFSQNIVIIDFTACKKSH